MDLLIRWVTPKSLALLALALAAGHLARVYQEPLLRPYREWRYPAQKYSGADGGDIGQRNEEIERRKVISRYNRLSALLDRAEADGFKVDPLKARARAALALNVPENRRKAVELLVQIEMNVPRKPTQYIPMYPNEEPKEDIAPDARSKAKATVKPKVKKKRKKVRARDE